MKRETRGTHWVVEMKTSKRRHPSISFSMTLIFGRVQGV